MKRWGMNWFAVALLVVAVSGCQSTGEKMALSGKALYDEKCRTVAGEKIYRTVPDVEGVVLMKIRPGRGDRELADPNWPGAAFGRENSTDVYIETFLGYERGAGFEGKPLPVTKTNRGFIGPIPPEKRLSSDLPGYRYADVIDATDGKRYRYSGRWEEPWQYDKSYLKGYIKFFLDKKSAPDPAPRYGVTFEDHVVPDERALWVASSTVKVVDLQTNEVLGEMTRYAWASPPNSASPSPWLRAYECPDHYVGYGSATRKFVDQVLIPKKED